MSNSFKKRAIRSFTHFWWATWTNHSWSLIFGEQPEQFAHITHYHSVKKRKWANHWFFSKNLHKTYQKKHFSQILLSASLVFCEQKSKWAICSEKRAICSFVHLSWATWANCSQSLICHLRLEEFTHGCSFDMSDLSKSLTVTHLSWLIWANCSQLLIWFEPFDSERMRKFPTLRIGEDFEEKSFLSLAKHVWIRIRSKIWNRSTSAWKVGSGSASKLSGSATLFLRDNQEKSF